jgi:hypothetical protein
VPDPAPGRKHSRWGLYLPFILLLIASIAWTVFWFYARGETDRRLTAGAEQLRAAGYEVSWRDRTLGGYPFRLDVTLNDARLRDPSGWAIATPKLEAEAFMHGLGHWVIATPQGLTFTRPQGGGVVVGGKLIRASLNSLDKTPPSFSFEGVKLTFAPAAGAQPFVLSSAERVEIYTRPGPDDQGAVMLKVESGKAQFSGLFGQIAGDKPVSVVGDAILTKMSAFHGRDWIEAVRAWSQAGGQINVRQAGVTAGDALIGAKPAVLTVGSDGRLNGALDVNLKQAPQALAALAQNGTLAPEAAAAAGAVALARQEGDVARATLTFQAGRTTLGPVAVGPSPRIY